MGQEWSKTDKRQLRNQPANFVIEVGPSSLTAGYIFGEMQKSTIISNILNEQHDETDDLMSFVANPAAQMLKTLENQSVYHWGLFPSILTVSLQL
jgi:hypothetical protein